MKSLFRKIYRALPFKSPLMHAVRAVGVPPPPVYRRLHFTGPFRVKNVDGKILRLYHHGALRGHAPWYNYLVCQSKTAQALGLI